MKERKLPFTPAQLQDQQHINVEAMYPYTSLGLSGIVVDRRVTKLLLVVKVTREDLLPAALEKYETLLQAVKELRDTVEVDKLELEDDQVNDDLLIENIPLKVVSAISIASHAIGRVLNTERLVLDTGEYVPSMSRFINDIQINIDETGYVLTRTKYYASGTEVRID